MSNAVTKALIVSSARTVFSKKAALTSGGLAR